MAPAAMAMNATLSRSSTLTRFSVASSEVLWDVGERTHRKCCCRRKAVPSSTYEDLREMDKNRTKLLKSQACDGQLELLCNISPSVLPTLLCSTEFWLSFAIYIVCRVLGISGYLEGVEIGEFRGLASVAVLLVFMINFYVNTCINRFFEANRHSMSLVQSMHNLSMALRGMLYETEEQKEMTRRCIDYMCAAHTFGYVGMSGGVYTTDNLWRGYNAEFGVLTPREDKIMQEYEKKEKGGSRYREALQWCFMELCRAGKQGIIPPPVLGGLYAKVMEFQNSMQALYDFKYQPIPFISEHLLLMFMQIYLPMQTLEMASQTQLLRDKAETIVGRITLEVFGFFLALMANMALQGLFWVGAYLEDPFGDNISDQRVTHFCRMATTECRRILRSGCPANGQLPSEQENEEKNMWLRKLSQKTRAPLSTFIGIRALAEIAKEDEALSRMDSMEGANVDQEEEGILKGTMDTCLKVDHQGCPSLKVEPTRRESMVFGPTHTNQSSSRASLSSDITITLSNNRRPSLCL